MDLRLHGQRCTFAPEGAADAADAPPSSSESSESEAPTKREPYRPVKKFEDFYRHTWLDEPVRGDIMPLNKDCHGCELLAAACKVRERSRNLLHRIEVLAPAPIVADSLSIGPTPAIALFATNARYKREPYRASEFAPRILAEHGLTVLMKSDHPVMNSRHLIYKAQQAYFYGLPENLASNLTQIASVISNSAEVMGMAHRIGYIKEGWDAGGPAGCGIRWPAAARAVDSTTGAVVFINVQSVFTHGATGVRQQFLAADSRVLGTVVAENGQITCGGVCSKNAADATVVDLEGGSISRFVQLIFVAYDCRIANRRQPGVRSAIEQRCPSDSQR
ncbi:hypothetical protein C8R47DRAFT_1073626 [Mycena vitilis]|nr:hypothetical protein C8R47DRAFT_1073626 [Mycena vitilis]